MSTQAFDNLTVLLQILQATRNLAKSMRDNAATWKAMANAQSPDVATLGQYLRDAGTSYSSILSKASSWVSANQTQATAAVGLIGASLTDLSDYASPLQTVATGLGTVDVSTYAKIITACNQILSAISAPASIFGT